MVKCLTFSLMVLLFIGTTAQGQNGEEDLQGIREELGAVYSDILRLFRAADYLTAIEINKQQLEGIKTHLGTRDSLYGSSTNSLAVLYRRAGYYDKALPYYHKAITHARENFGIEHPEYGNRVNNLAEFHRVRADYHKALPLFYEALANAKANYGRESRQYALILSNIGRTLTQIGRPEESLELFQEAHAYFSNQEPREHQIYIAVLSNLASSFRTLGRLDEAYNYYLEAAAVSEEFQGREHASYARRIGNLGLFYLETGQLDKALESLELATEITANTMGTSHRSYGARLNNLASIYSRMGDNDKALQYYYEAANIYRLNSGKSHPVYAVALDNLAGVYLIQGDLERARSYYEQAREITASTEGIDHPTYALRLANIGELYLKKGDLHQARELLNQSLSIVRSSYGENHFSFGERLSTLARIEIKSGNYDLALEAFLKANPIFKDKLRQVAALGSEEERWNFLKTFSGFFDQIQGFGYLTNYEFELINELIYENAIALNSLIFKSTASLMREIRQTENEETIQLYNEWRELKNRIAREYTKSEDERIPYLDSLERQVELWEGQLARSSTILSQTLQLIKWRDIANTLNKDEVVVEFSSFQYNRDSEDVIYSAILISPGAATPIVVPLFKESDLVGVFDRESGLSEKEFINRIYRGDRINLFELIFEPLNPYLKNKKTIYYAPTGRLAKLNLNALIDRQGMFILEKYQMIRLRNTADILQSSRKGISPESILLVGGIDFNYGFSGVDFDTSSQKKQSGETSSEEASSQREPYLEWEYLPGTLTEVQNLAKLLDGQMKVSLLTDNEASEDTIKKLDGNSPHVLHISTHGFFFLKDDEVGGVDKRLLDFLQIDDPLLRSGLLLAGGNLAWRGNLPAGTKEDGILTAMEISHLDLSNTRLVVLSACETGLGDLRGTEGVLGLQRAFQLAGTDYIIISQWKVPDQITSELMETFYKKWLSGISIRKAFRKAQLKLSESHPPYYWGGFVLTGGGKELSVKVSFISQQSVWTLAFSALGVLALLVILNRWTRAKQT